MKTTHLQTVSPSNAAFAFMFPPADVCGGGEMALLPRGTSTGAAVGGGSSPGPFPLCVGEKSSANVAARTGGE